MKFLSWSLNAPISAKFNQYKQKVGNEWITINSDAPKSWTVNERGFVQAVELYHEKIYAIGMHEFGVNPDGTIYDYKAPSLKVLTPDENSINSWVPTSLRYMMDTYPNIKWSIQVICFNDPQVNNVLRNTTVQNTFIRQLKRIVELYKQAGYPIAGIESDFERVRQLDGDAERYRDLLIRMKNEICIPLGIELRVNLYAMTGNNNPNYYAWHNYPTIAQANCDEYQLMTYDFSWAGSAPGPSTPVWWLNQVLNWVAQSLPANKVFIGNAAYGRRWNIDSEESWGRTVTYKQLVQWQNGIYRHNEGAMRPDGTFWWANQPFLPFCGNHDNESNYQVSYLHVYDKFTSNYLEDVQNINRGVFNNANFITSYSKRQRPIFGGVELVLSNGDATGEARFSMAVTRNDEGIPNTVFYGYTVNRQQFAYDENLEQCVPAIVDYIDGEYVFSEPGRLEYNFYMTGTYRLIALVSFPMYGADRIDISVNGSYFMIGGNKLEDWYPYYVLGSHYYDCGSWSFNGNNTIVVNRTYGGAVIYGFVLCTSFNENFKGGLLKCNANIQKVYKRDTVENGVLKKVKSDVPEQLTVTMETIRRIPRPAIMWEDNALPYVKQTIPNRDLTRTSYYRRANPNSYAMGSGTIPYDEGDRIICIDGVEPVGFSSGEWIVNDAGYISCNNGQLMLDKLFSCNVRCEMTVRVMGGVSGIRFKASQRGRSDEGYLFLLDFSQRRVRLVYQNGTYWQTIEDIAMSTNLYNTLGSEIVMFVTIHNGQFRGGVGTSTYISRSLSGVPTQGAYGVYASGGETRLRVFSVQTTDRYEPLEKLAAIVDGVRYEFGEVPRNVGYDKYGYLLYSGLDVASTEIVPEEWDLDYRHSPVATIPGWEGEKEIFLEFVDAGIWTRAVYIGDAEGFSVAWNGDAQSFRKTIDIIQEYSVKGVGMWTLGQEDISLFTYLPDADI